MSTKKLTVIFPLLCFYFSVIGQEGELQFYQNGYYIRQYSEVAGLVYNGCKNLYQDTKGFLWITTFKGVSRFDGKQFVNYGINEGLPGANVNQISEDSLGYIYVATTAGIARFTGYNKTTNGYFYVYPQTTNRPFPIAGAVAIDSNTILFQQKNGAVFLLRNNRLEQLSANSTFGDNHIYRKNYDYYYAYVTDTIRVFNAQFKNVKNIFVHDSGYSTVFIDDTGRLHLYYNGAQRIVNGTTVTDAAPLPDSIIFANSATMNRLLYFKQGAIYSYDNNESTKILDMKSLGLKGSGLLAGRNGVLWACANGGGLFRITPLIYNNKNVPADGYYFYYQNGRKIVEADAYPNDTSKSQNRKNDLENLSNTIFKDRSGTIWYCTRDGVYRKTLDEKMEHFSFPGRAEMWTDYANSIQDAAETPNGDIWFYGYCGAVLYRQGKFKHYTEQNGIRYGRVRQLVVDKNGTVLLIDADHRLLRVQDDTVLPFTDITGITGFDTDKMKTDGHGCIWIEFNKRLYKIEKKQSGKYEITDSLVCKSDDAINEIRAFEFDQQDNCWIGSGGGKIQVYFLRPDGHYDYSNSISYNRDDGLTPIITSTYNLWHDEKNNILLVPDKLGERTMLVFSLKDALKRKKIPLLKITLTGIRINYKEPDWIAMKYIPGPAGIPSSFKLDYTSNNIIFNYTAPSVSNAEDIVYKVMLKGYDREWRTTSATTASYTNLPPGNYTFLIKAANANGVWGETCQYHFIISPPWYKTGWAILLSIALCILVIYFIFFLRLNALRMRNLRENSLFKSNLIGLIGHDMVTPLLYIAKVSRQLRSYKEKLSKQTTLDSLGEIDTTATRLHFFAESIVHWIKTQNMNFKPVFEKFSISKAIKELIDFHYPLATEKGNELYNEVQQDLQGYQDTTLVRVILHNLLLNANKFTSNGEIIITASMENDWLTISVKDTGKGMDENKVNSLNNLQSIVSSPGTHKEKGWGMGYRIITDLLKFTGGKLHVNSRLNEGTEVTIKLPCNENLLFQKDRLFFQEI